MDTQLLFDEGVTAKVEELQAFLNFMAMQLKKSLALEIERFNASRKQGFNFMF